jgi:hypothetical protein
MTTLLIITAPWEEKDAINAELIALGHGPCMSIAMVGDRNAQRDEDGILLETPTHVGTSWWVAPNESTLATIQELRGTLFAKSNILIRGEASEVPEGLDVIPGDIADVKGTWNAMVGDSIVLRHKQFGAQWGWRAEMNVQSGDFEPGVRAVAIYSDANHQNYSYTTGAFVWDAAAQRWATEWNPGHGSKQTFHWAVLYASLQEQKGTLAADADASALFLKYGLPAPEPEPGAQWVDTGVTIIQLVAAGVYRCSGIPTIALNQAIRLGDTSAGETVFTGYWPTTGTPSDYIKIAPHVSVANGAKVYKWE